MGEDDEAEISEDEEGFMMVFKCKKKYRLMSTNLASGKTIELSGTFNTKREGQEFVKGRNEMKTTYKVGGRGFRTKEEAENWLEARARNPPIGMTSEDIYRRMKVEPIPLNQQTRLSIRREC